SADWPSLVIATTSPGRRRIAFNRSAIKKALRKTSGIQGDRARRGEIRSTRRRPGAVRFATGRAAFDLRLGVDVDRVRVLAARAAIGLIGGARDDVPVAPGIRIAPGDRRPRRAALQRLNLGSVGAALIVIIERGADATAG